MFHYTWYNTHDISNILNINISLFEILMGCVIDKLLLNSVISGGQDYTNLIFPSPKVTRACSSAQILLAPGGPMSRTGMGNGK